jgi:hypothetical protein
VATSAGESKWLVSTSSAPLDLSVPVSFHVALPVPASVRRAVDTLHAEVSDPDHARYGQYVAPADLRALSASDPAVVGRVTVAFATLGVSCENLGSALRCSGPAPRVEEALETSLARYVHSATGASVVRIAPGATVGLPSPLADHADIVFVSGLHLIPSTARGRASKAMLGGSGRNLDPTTVPETIRKMYNISVRGDPKVVQAAGEFPGNWVENVSDNLDR